MTHHKVGDLVKPSPNTVLSTIKATMKTTVLPSDRLRLLLAHKNTKMAASAHAYVRGSTKRFYEWIHRADRVELTELGRSRDASFEAPSWLWNASVPLF